jgi:alpha-tubulin suppressor-like RCC1 family protein
MSGGPGGGGAGGLACGDAGEACCAGNTCGNNLLCLNGTTCSCAKALVGRYLLRTDGALLYEADATSTTQTPVLDGTTGLPLTGVTGVQEGALHGCAVLGPSKTAWCWRTGANGNASGQLGNGTMDTLATSFQATEVLTAANTPLTNVVGIATTEIPNVFSTTKAGTGCAVTSEGKIYCWGDVTYLANGGTSLISTYAVPITTDGATPFTGALQVSLNSDEQYACATVQGSSSSEVWCWGDNQGGWLGLGDATARNYPTKVLGISTSIKVIASGPAVAGGGDTSTTCDLDGTNVRCWGENSYGETGTGVTSAAPLLSPALVTLMGGTTPLGTVADLHGGTSSFFTNFCALTTANSLFCWGYLYQAYPTEIATDVAELGGTGAYIRYLTSNGLYHFGTANNHVGTTRVPNCGPLH